MRSENGARRALEAEWAPDGDGLAALSVRSAFDLYLSALDLPVGSEVLLSGVSISDMARIVREHGLIPVPVDIALDTLFPTPRDCERAASPASRLLVIAHLFGGRNDIAPIAAWAKARGIPIIEDCAQGFISPAERGSPHADATFYSFGSIKTMTALGGALVRVRDAQVLERMRTLQDAWPVQSTRRYASKVTRAALLLLVQRPMIYAAIALACELTGRSFDRLIQSAVRGFPVPPGGSLLPLLRHRPCGALLAFLLYRLRTFSGTRLAERAFQGDRVRDALLPIASVFGAAQPGCTHWLFAIVSSDREAAVTRGTRLGLDVAAGASSIAAIPRPAERPDLPPMGCEWFMQRILFIPVQPEIPPRALAEIASVVAPSTLGYAKALRRSVLALLLCVPLGVEGQEPQAAEAEDFIRYEFAPALSLMGDQRSIGGTFGIFIGAFWIGLAPERAYRLGLTLATIFPDDPPPRDPAVGELSGIFASALTLERLRLKVKGRRIITTGVGLGVGAMLYDVLQDSTGGTQSVRSVNSWVPTVTGSAEVAYRLPFVGSSPIDFFVGLRSVLMIGSRTLRGDPPSSGPIPTSRGIGHVNQLAFGVRMGKD